MLLHAFPLDHRMWEHQAVALGEAGWRVIVPDLPGFGGTAVLDAAPSLDAVADGVLDDLARQGVDRAIVGGLSLGGYVTMALLRKRPEVFAAVMLCDTKASADDPHARQNRHRLAEAVQQDPSQAGRILRHAVLPGLVGSTTHDRRPEVVQRIGGWLDEAPAATVAWYQQAMAERADSHEVLASLDVPVLVLWGQEDTLSPAAEQASMLAAVRRGEERIIPGCGHLSAVEDPEPVSRTLVTFAEALRPPFA